MKTITLCLLAATSVLSFQSATAQLQLGGILGLNVASTGIDPEPSFRNYSSSLRFGIGAVVDYPITEKIDLHGQLMVQGKGSKITDEDFSDDLIYGA